MSDQKMTSSGPKSKKGLALSPIPDKLYFTIGEVGKLCQLRPHVLRYWEQEFNQLSPTKRRGNRRYYQHQDVVLIRRIRHLLYEQGYTIEGARQQLVSETSKGADKPQSGEALGHAIADLEKALNLLQAAAG